MKLFLGYDKREAIGFHVFMSSLLRYASVPVSIHPLGSCGLPEGSNTFTKSRFLVPFLCGFQGLAVFADASDMLVLDDIADLQRFSDPTKAVWVVRHVDYESRHARKYVGTDMECENHNYPRKNWASLMVINCAHPGWRGMTPEIAAALDPIDLLQFAFLADSEIGELPDRWNRLADEGHQIEGAALLHWTAGVPAFDHYRNAPGARLWHLEKQTMETV